MQPTATPASPRTRWAWLCDLKREFLAASATGVLAAAAGLALVTFAPPLHDLAADYLKDGTERVVAVCAASAALAEIARLQLARAALAARLRRLAAPAASPVIP